MDLKQVASIGEILAADLQVVQNESGDPKAMLATVMASAQQMIPGFTPDMLAIEVREDGTIAFYVGLPDE